MIPAIMAKISALTPAERPIIKDVLSYLSFASYCYGVKSLLSS
jgi:hypothetical protein